MPCPYEKRRCRAKARRHIKFAGDSRLEGGATKWDQRFGALIGLGSAGIKPRFIAQNPRDAAEYLVARSSE
jgi:hypothetical protein